MAGWEPKTNASFIEKPKRDRSKPAYFPPAWTIDKDVPIPPIRKGRATNRTGLTAALRAMEINDSVLVGAGAAWAASKISAVHAEGDARYVTRTMEDGLRIWRVE